EENTVDASPPDLGKRKLEIGHERFDVGPLRNVSPRLVGIGSAVGALLHEPGNMDVESEGREHSKPDAGGRESHYLRHLQLRDGLITATLLSPPPLRRGGGRRPPGWSFIKRPLSVSRAAAAAPCRGGSRDFFARDRARRRSCRSPSERNAGRSRTRSRRGARRRSRPPRFLRRSPVRDPPRGAGKRRRSSSARGGCLCRTAI